MMIIIKILVFIIVLSVIIVVHEAGHFFAAKKFGVLCHEFSLGMGPAIYKKKKGETTYAVRCIPIGGYVSMAGEQYVEDIIKPGDTVGLNLENGVVTEIILDEKMNSDVRGRIIRRNLYSRKGDALEIELTSDYETPVEELDNLEGDLYTVKEDAFFVDNKFRLQIAPYKRCLESKPLWQRFIIIFAGPFMNLVLAMIIYLICAFASGTPKYSSTVVGAVDKDFPGYSIIEKGDKIEAVNGKEITSWKQFSNYMSELALSGETEITIVLNNDGVSRTEVINPAIVINSIGLSNLSIKDKYNSVKEDFSIVGAQIGSTALRYKSTVKSKETQLSNGDVITAINIYNHGEEYDASSWKIVTSWSDLVLEFVDADVCNVYFRYYDCETNEYHDTYEDSQKAETYGNEVLDNQRIQKIKLYLGISPIYHHNFLESIEAAGNNFWDDFTLIFRTLKLLIHPSGVRQVGVNNLSGVVGIYSLLGSYMSAGIIALLLFMALLSVNIGVMNLLPIPALDGGRIVFILIEGITRKPLNRKVEAMINNIMFILLLIFMIYIAYNDVLRIAK